MAGFISRTSNDFRQQIRQLTEIGIALSSELRLERLLDKTLTIARQLTGADAGTLYMVEENSLVFKILQNESLNIHRGGSTGTPIGLEPVRMDPKNVSAWAALNGKTIRIGDVYASEDFDFSGPRRYDKMTGYHSRSMLVVPMRNHRGECLGVLQLINAIDPVSRSIVAFSDEDVNLSESLASQAAVAMSNARLIDETRSLFDAIIRVLAMAVDQKSPHTGNHVQRVAELNLFLAQAINRKNSGPLKQTRFTAQEMEAIRVAGWLHDVGKVTTPVWIMEKSRKLETIFDRIHLIETRFDLIRSTLRRQGAERQLALARQGADDSRLDQVDAELGEALKALDQDLEIIRKCNQPQEQMEDGRLEALKAIAAKTYDHDGQKRPYLTANEMYHLSIRRGSLTPEELELMRDHVQLTKKILAHVPFTGALQKVPLYASQHHEKLNGSGYPDGLKGDAIPLPSRILAVADMYEALSAKDRPYKKAIPEEQVIAMLQEAADQGELDADIVAMIVEDQTHKQFEDYYTNTQTRTGGGSLNV